MLLKILSALIERRTDAALVITVCLGAWVCWSPFSELSTLSRWYERVEAARSGTPLPNPDYDLSTLPWQLVHPNVFKAGDGQLRLITDTEPFAYQAFATVGTKGASAADIQFEAEIESGGITIGLIQSGKWIAVSSSQRSGVFADTNWTQLGFSRSITVMIANNNAAGRTRLTIKSLRLYLRK